MRTIYTKPQIWIFSASGFDVITVSGGGGGNEPDPGPGTSGGNKDPWGDDMDW